MAIVELNRFPDLFVKGNPAVACVLLRQDNQSIIFEPYDAPGVIAAIKDAAREAGYPVEDA